MSEINHENILIQLRDALHRNGIKLWLEPYSIHGEPNDAELANLAAMMAQQVNINQEVCRIAINELQNTAIDNLKSIDEYNQTGIATLKIRVPSKANGTKMLCLKIKLVDNAQELQAMIAAKLSVPQEKIKVIANGKVLDLQKSLLEQGVKNNKQIMAVVTEGEDGKQEDPYQRIRKIRREAEVLLNSKDSGFLALEDQSGKAIHLPESERRSIIMSLLLYEKGRVQLKQEKFSDALILFLEADEELKSCNSTLVQSVDNVALLNLDIVWCYLNLRSIMQLPDAETRLKICEDNFKRSYGENLSRVESVKGSSENEKTLIARLQLMKGVLYFHQNRRLEAQSMMNLAEQSIQALKVNEASMELLIEMGYTKSEAITGLRSSYNSISDAINFIAERRGKLKESRREAKVEKEIQKSLSSLGITANPRSVMKLTSMGYAREMSALALEKCKDDIPEALNLLQTNQDVLKAELANLIKPSQEFVDQLVTLGYDKSIAESVLKLHLNDFQSALDALIEMQRNNSIPQEVLNAANHASTSSASHDSASSEQKALEKEKREEAEAAAFEELRTDLDHLDEDDNYLTFTLEKEEALLAQYKAALSN